MAASDRKSFITFDYFSNEARTREYLSSRMSIDRVHVKGNASNSIPESLAARVNLNYKKAKLTQKRSRKENKSEGVTRSAKISAYEVGTGPQVLGARLQTNVNCIFMAYRLGPNWKLLADRDHAGQMNFVPERYRDTQLFEEHVRLLTSHMQDFGHLLTKLDSVGFLQQPPFFLPDVLEFAFDLPVPEQEKAAFMETMAHRLRRRHGRITHSEEDDTSVINGIRARSAEGILTKAYDKAGDLVRVETVFEKDFFNHNENKELRARWKSGEQSPSAEHDYTGMIKELAQRALDEVVPILVNQDEVWPVPPGESILRVADALGFPALRAVLTPLWAGRGKARITSTASRTLYEHFRKLQSAGILRRAGKAGPFAVRAEFFSLLVFCAGESGLVYFDGLLNGPGASAESLPVEIVGQVVL